jgi:hypothetical protein
MMKKSMAFASAAVPAMAFGSAPASMMQTLGSPLAPRMASHDGAATPAPERHQALGVPRALLQMQQQSSAGQLRYETGSGKGVTFEEKYVSLAPTKQGGSSSLPPGTIDFTAIPKQLDSKFEAYDTDSALRPTIIKTDSTWSRMRQENLLTRAQRTWLGPDEIKTEKSKAFDLLDALSRSGSLPIACAELHVVVAVTHCFEKDVMNTVIQDNVNPIEKVEKTMLLMTSTIHNVPASTLLADEVQSARLGQSFPALFAEEEHA